MRHTSTTRLLVLLVLLAMLAPAPATADDQIALSGSTRDVVASAASSEPSSGDADDLPQVVEREAEPSDARPPRGRARRQGNGDRRVPELRGASFDRAQRLGLGTRDAAVTLLHDGPKPAWVTAAGRTRIRNLRWPVDEGGFGRGVGYVRTDRPEVPHNGVDIVAPRGSVIHAAADGIVAYSDNGLRGYGNCVIIVHPNGWITLYGHADRTTVQPGWRVRRGERIGFVGSTGHSQGPHLHFELRVDGRPVDPLEHFHGQPWVTGRSRLAELRARPDGGHSREHLGEITPDFTPAPDLAPAVARTSIERAEARRVAARMARSRARTAVTSEPEPEASPERATTPEPSRARATTPEPSRARTTTPEPSRARATTPEPSRARTTPSVRPAPAPLLATSGFPVAPPEEIVALLARGPRPGMVAAIEGRTFSTLLFPLRDGQIVRGRTRIELRTEAGAALRVAADGRVVYIGHGIVGEDLSVVVVHRDGLVTVYTGFARVHVEVGASVLRGSWLGPVRESGEASFEVRARGERIDPRPRFALAPTVPTTTER